MARRLVGIAGLLAGLFSFTLLVPTACSLSPTDPVVSQDTTTDPGGDPGGANSIQPGWELAPLSW